MLTSNDAMQEMFYYGALFGGITATLVFYPLCLNHCFHDDVRDARKLVDSATADVEVTNVES